MNKIAKYLNQHILGNVLAGSSEIEFYSTDKSILKIKPQTIAVPRSTQDVRKIMRFASQLAEKNMPVSVTVRGKGNDKTGAAIGEGLVMLTGAMNQVLELDIKQRLVRVQPGITIGELNAVLATHGMIIPVSPKYNGHSVGGLIGNNLAGEASGKYGRLVNYVNQAEVVLANGDLMHTERVSKREVSRRKGMQTYEGNVFRKLETLIEDKGQVIDEFLATDTPDNTGYGMLANVRRKDGSMDILPLFFGAQGTLGVVSELILRAEYVSGRTDLLVIEAPNIDTARDLIDQIAPLGPSQLGFYSADVFAAAITQGYKYPLKLAADGKPLAEVVLTVVFDDLASRTRLRCIKRAMHFASKASAHATHANKDNLEQVCSVFDVVEDYLNVENKGVKIPVVDGAFIPRVRFGEYLAAIKALEKRLGVDLAVYGSASDGIYSIRPNLDLSVLAHRQLVFKLLKEYSVIVQGLDGNITGDGAEGRLKTIVTRANTDPQLAELFAAVKQIFDPHGVLNPGVKGEVDLKWLLAHLRSDYVEGIIKE
jgi:FAD/FMN-containing dehydrogenase